MRAFAFIAVGLLMAFAIAVMAVQFSPGVTLVALVTLQAVAVVCWRRWRESRAVEYLKILTPLLRRRDHCVGGSITRNPANVERKNWRMRMFAAA